MRLLGLDIGEARVGVAVSDPDATVASPVAVLDGRILARDIRPLRLLVEDYEPAALVVGLPVGMNGEEGQQAAAVRAIADGWSDALGLPVTYVDERLSSAEAARSMRAAGVPARKQRGQLDMVAAALILQSHLDTLRRSSPDVGHE
ncbi:MAG: Holliday junction resolvase RuvX [Coriobacteriia bacterium]